MYAWQDCPSNETESGSESELGNMNLEQRAWQDHMARVARVTGCRGDNANSHLLAEFILFCGKGASQMLKKKKKKIGIEGSGRSLNCGKANTASISTLSTALALCIMRGVHFCKSAYATPFPANLLSSAPPRYYGREGYV